MELFEPTLNSLIILLFVAVLAGYIDTLVGGGGLITIPALLALGVPPLHALGTNKLQAVAGSGLASFTVLRRGDVRFSDVRWLMVMAFIGALFGSVIVQFFDTQVLNIAIPVVIVLIAVYFIVAPKPSSLSTQAKISKRAYGMTATPSIGIYDGMFGPGTGSLLVFAGVSLRGQPIVEATLIAKTLNFATNLAALFVFISFGKVVWLVGGMMMIGQFVGANLGVRSLMTIDPNFLRYMVIGICFINLIWWGLK